MIVCDVERLFLEPLHLRHDAAGGNPLFELFGRELDRRGLLAGGLTDQLLLLLRELDSDRLGVALSV
jgi:hypothetical protein